MNDKNRNLDLEPIIYKTKDAKVNGNVFYFHGGGLLFGMKQDLPKYHIEKINEAGYNIYAFNYPLAPETEFYSIIEQIITGINSYALKFKEPYFLWGRSAGAYLSLLSTSLGLEKKPNGIISYYGYGFLIDDWYSTPSKYYLEYPIIEFKDVEHLIEDYPLVQSPVNPRFLLYLYTRQTGKWLEFIGGKKDKDFLEKFTLKNEDFSTFPPVFLAHNTNDNDVPYEESIELQKRINEGQLFTCTTEDHDFDRNTDSPLTIDLIHKTIDFLNSNL